MIVASLDALGITLAIVGVVAWIIVIASMVGRGLMRIGADYPEHPTFPESPIEDFVEERRQAEKHTMAAVRRSQARREVAGLPAARPVDRRGRVS